MGNKDRQEMVHVHFYEIGNNNIKVSPALK